jgi:hypothetical protein
MMRTDAPLNAPRDHAAPRAIQGIVTLSIETSTTCAVTRVSGQFDVMKSAGDVAT